MSDEESNSYLHKYFIPLSNSTPKEIVHTGRTFHRFDKCIQIGQTRFFLLDGINEEKRRELGLGKQPYFLTSIIQQLAKAGTLPPHLILENVLDWKNRKFSLETEDVDGDLITIIDKTNLKLIKRFPVHADQLLAKVRAYPQKYGLIPSPEASDLHPSPVSISDPAPAPIQAAPPGNRADAYANGPDVNGHIAAAAAAVDVAPMGGLAEPSDMNRNGLRSAEPRTSRGSVSSNLRDVDIVAHIEQSNNGQGGYDLWFDDEDDSERQVGEENRLRPQSEFLSDTLQVRRDVQPLIITRTPLSVYLQARIKARSGEVVAFCRDALEILEVADKNACVFQDLPGFKAAHIDAVVPAILLRQFRAQSERVRQKAMEIRNAQTEAERYGNELNFLEKEIEKRMPGGLMSLMQVLKHTVSHTVKQEVDLRLKGKGDGTLSSTSAPHPLPKEKSQHKKSAPPGDAEKRGGNTQKKKKGNRQKKDQTQTVTENYKSGQKRNAPTDSSAALQERDGNAEGKQTEDKTEQQQKKLRSDGEAGRGDGNFSYMQHSSNARVQQTHAGQGQNPHP
uniref:Uncharacterized protein n=1 Tax=Chromera velia CCMP2878 TaxID=1169474 RepID=A0A0G4HB55_9ALVE|eukprot:Cvel_25848.t1-p1 / transcript=Cvel_25848.t1 / gene=Cvel_25848 / organism=Chromera_velia_CCMP2878 / gene_product=hypothetical protein / transcript_product=hypothetical protein / location=Cvel_scaffold2980:11686-14858(+) / protein_length=561 / sequence_SO=supercontig / SO=protein_coding / is_pseudo=false